MTPEEEKYNEIMIRLSELREKSIEDQRAREEYNRVLESPEFQELENILLSYATDK